MTAPSPKPTKFPSGVSTDFVWGILRDYAAPNPAKYHTYFDDFDWLNSGNTSSLYTATKTGTSAALASQGGDGGQLLFTTGTASGNVTVLTTAVCPFVIPVLPKRMFYMTRVQISDITNVGFWAGLIAATGGVPITTIAGITDGIYFTKADNSATAVNLLIVSGGTTQATVAIPANVITTYLLANTWIDMGFEVTTGGDVLVFFGYPYVGYIPAQQTPPYGPVAAYRQPNPATTFSTVKLAPTIMAEAGNTAQPTLTLDFQMAAVER